MKIDDMTDIELESLVGEHMLDGVDMDSTQVETWGNEFTFANVIRFRLDGVVYMAVEDPIDGYRSSMDKIFVCSDTIKNTFHPVKVLGCMETASDPGYKSDTLCLRDLANGKTILRVGTDNIDDYYPWFVGEWTPQNMANNEPT